LVELEQSLIDAFMDGLCKESQHDFRRLSTLLASLPDPSLSHGQVMTVPVTGQVMVMPVTEARERGLIPEASDETLQVFSSS
jgi:hypothetical protein